MIVDFSQIKENLFIQKHEDALSWDESILFLWGGRYGAKTQTIARKLVIQCLRDPYFRCVISRKVYGTIKNSNYQTIYDFVHSNNLESLFKFTVSPLEITCINGNKFIAKGFDKAMKTKGIEKPTHFWAEELSEYNYEDFITGLTTLRGVEKPQFIGTFNPEADIEITDFWLYDKFFKHNLSKDFTDNYNIEILVNGEIEFEKLTVKSVHTTSDNNKYLSNRERAIVNQFKLDYERTGSQIAQYYYKVWTLGEWGNRFVDLRYYSSFSEILHIKELQFNENETIHLTFDKNVNPYLSCQVWQAIDQKHFHQIHEFALAHPKNRTRIIGHEVIKYLNSINYYAKVFIYGDSTALNDDTNQEIGQNFFTIIETELRANGYLATFRVPGKRSNQFQALKRRNKNPNSTNAADFINSIYDGLVKDYSITIGNNCKISVNDYINAKQDKNGKIDKSEKDTKTGGEKYGHFSDCKKYFICEYLYEEFEYYQKHRQNYL